MIQVGKIFVVLGLVCVFVGIFLWIFERWKFEGFFGDVYWNFRGLKVGFLFGTSLVVSLVLTIVLNLLAYLLKRQ